MNIEMIKRIKFLMPAVALSSLVLLTSCGEKKGGEATPAVVSAEAKGQETTFPIAYVRMDSITNQYKYSQDIQAALSKDAEGHKKRLQSKLGALQSAAAEFERRARINAFVSQEAAQAEQNKVLKLQQEVQALEAELGQKFAEKQALMLEDMMKKIQEEIKAFNTDGKYKLILTNASVLFADEAMDITDAFIAHLNSNYTPEKASAPETDAKN